MRAHRTACLVVVLALACACGGTTTGSNIEATPTADGGANASASADNSNDARANVGRAIANPNAWRFVVVGDTHVITPTTAIPSEMVSFILADAPSLVLVPGDIVDSGKGVNDAEMELQLDAFHTVMAPLRDKGIGVYPVRGNHENDVVNSAAAWKTAFSGVFALPSSGPASETDLTYSFTHENALFVGLDDYANIHRVNQAWLDPVLAGNTLPHIFVFGHEPAFKDFHTDCLGTSPTERNTFWKSLTNAGAKVYFSGHDHFFDAARIDDGDGSVDNDLYQVIVGTGGGKFPANAGNYNGNNVPYKPVNVFHEVQNGYLLVEISNADVTLTFKHRACDAALKCTYEPTESVLRYSVIRK